MVSGAPKAASSPESDRLWYDVGPKGVAATLIILYGDPANPRVVLSVRSLALRMYPGQTALPGGKADRNEDWWATALREANEEIGFDPQMFVTTQLSALPAHLSRHYVVVRPCVLFVSPKPSQPEIKLSDIAPRIASDEVASVYSLHLSHFLKKKHLDPDNLSQVEWSGYAWWYYDFPVLTANWIFANAKQEKHFEQEFNGTAVTGLTAHILVDAAKWYFGAKPDFPAVPGLGWLDGIRMAIRNGHLLASERL